MARKMYIKKFKIKTARLDLVNKKYLIKNVKNTR